MRGTGVGRGQGSDGAPRGLTLTGSVPATCSLPSVRATVGSVQAGKVKGQALSDHPSLSLCPQLELQATGAHP